MGAYWEQRNIFPSIARIIRDCYRRERRFVTHDEIVAGLLRDPEASAIIREAHARQGEKQSVEWLAHNMVAWFSQRITVAESEWDQQLERENTGGGWAYKPKDTTA